MRACFFFFFFFCFCFFVIKKHISSEIVTSINWFSVFIMPVSKADKIMIMDPYYCAFATEIV